MTAHFLDPTGLNESYERREAQLDHEQLEDGGYHPEEIIRTFARTFPVIFNNEELRETCKDMVDAALEEGKPNNWGTYWEAARELCESEGIPIATGPNDGEYENYRRESMAELQQNRIGGTMVVGKK